MHEEQFLNPQEKSVGDCPAQAIAKALDMCWEEVYAGLCLEGFLLADMPNADGVWGPYLYEHGFRRRFIPDDGLGRYTVADFARDNPRGTFILSMPGRHVLCVEDGDYYDSWDSGRETILFLDKGELRDGLSTLSVSGLPARILSHAAVGA